MTETIHPSVKICCISSKEEAMLAIKHGASALGLVGEMPSGPGVISDVLIKEIAQIIPQGVDSFLLTSKTNALDIIKHHQTVNTNTIQIVDELREGKYQEIRDQLPTIKIVQVIHVIDEQSVEQAMKVAKHVDAILLDSGNLNLTVKELGGTGKVHNWDLSKTIREEINIPLYLAGGLNALNVKKAINYVQPFGIDLCSGVRTNGKLDEHKLKTFFEAIRNVSS